MKRKILICCSCWGCASEPPRRNLDCGIVYDPTNYQTRCFATTSFSSNSFNCKNSYAKITHQLQPRHADVQILQNMPARYRAAFSQWRNVTSHEHLWQYRDPGLAVSTPACSHHQHRLSAGDNTTASSTTRTNCREWTPTNSAASSPSTRLSNSPTARTRLRWPPSARSVATPRDIQDTDRLTSNRTRSRAIPISTGSLRSQQDQRGGCFDSSHAPGLEQTPRVASRSSKPSSQSNSATPRPTRLTPTSSRQASIAGNMAQVTGTLTNSLQNFRMP